MHMHMDSSAVSDPKVFNATRKVIADSAGVQESSTTVELSLVRRRLQTSLRRLALADIKALYAITIPSSSPEVSGAGVAASLRAKNTSSLTAALTSALEAAGANYTVTVTRLTAATVQQVAITTPHPEVGSSRPPQGGPQPGPEGPKGRPTGTASGAPSTSPRQIFLVL